MECPTTLARLSSVPRLEQQVGNSVEHLSPWNILCAAWSRDRRKKGKYPRFCCGEVYSIKNIVEPVMSPLREIILFSPAAGKCEQSMAVFIDTEFRHIFFSLKVYAARLSLYLPVCRYYKVWTVIYRHVRSYSDILIRWCLLFRNPICTRIVCRLMIAVSILMVNLPKNFMAAAWFQSWDTLKIRICKVTTIHGTLRDPCIMPNKIWYFGRLPLKYVVPFDFA